MKSLTDAEIEEIAEKAAEKAVEKITAHFYQEIGKTVVKRVLVLLGVVAVGITTWMAGHGWLK